MCVESCAKITFKSQADSIFSNWLQQRRDKANHRAEDQQSRALQDIELSQYRVFEQDPEHKTSDSGNAGYGSLAQVTPLTKKQVA
jgi:hypothetical protein